MRLEQLMVLWNLLNVPFKDGWKYCNKQRADFQRQLNLRIRRIESIRALAPPDVAEAPRKRARILHDIQPIKVCVCLN